MSTCAPTGRSFSLIGSHARLKGVVARGDKWRARIKADGKRIYLGTFRIYPLTASDSCISLPSLKIPADVGVNLVPLYVRERVEARLRVDERVRQSVVFIGLKTPNGFSPYGTALLGLAIHEDMCNAVVITAKHVLDDIPGETAWIRVNTKDGGSTLIDIRKSIAITFKDKAIDLAVLPFGVNIEHEVYAIPLQSSAWADQIATFGEPTFGDEVCVVGLYTTHYGHVRNIPAVRVGHLAALPEELVMTDRGYVLGYLIECHSIAGLSGSPVYWNVPQLRVVDGKIHKNDAPQYVPLGILIGYHVIESKEDEIVVPQFQQTPEHRKDEPPPPRQIDERRTGFAVVLPIQRIYEIFESEPMKTVLKEGVEHIRKKSGYRRASAAPPLEVDLPASGANPKHREDFNSLVDAAARKREQED